MKPSCSTWATFLAAAALALATLPAALSAEEANAPAAA